MPLELDCSPSLLFQTVAAARPKAKDAKLTLNVDAKLSPGEFRTWIILAPFVALAATAGPEAKLDLADSQKRTSSVTACVAVAGPSTTNDERALLNARKPNSNYQLFFGGLPEVIPEIYEQGSPSHWVSGNEPPMLFITEGNPDAHKAIRSRLDKMGIRNEGFNLTGGLHSEWNWEPWFTPTMEVAEKFIQSVLTQ